MIGATIAQADFGDTKEHNSTTTTGHTTAGGLVYPDYFPNWSSGDGHLIEKEHKKLKGEYLRVFLHYYLAIKHS